MNILFVSSDINPFGPIGSGDAQRTRLLLQACATLGHVDLVTFQDHAVTDIDNVRIIHSGAADDSPQRRSRWAKWASVMPWGGLQSLFPVSKSREAVIDNIVANGHYDFIVSRYLFRTLPCGLLKYGKRLVVDADDDLSFFFLNQIGKHSNLAQRLRLHLAAAKARRLTPATVRKMHTVFFSNQHTAKLNGGTYLPNIPFRSDTCPDADFSIPCRRILFVGQLNYPPNRDGLDHFLEHIYAPLAAAMPQLEMHIVGHLNDQDTANRWGHYPGVRLTGFVDDLQHEYTQAHVVVAPIYRCGGTNIKLLEAMQMNRCCVTTKEAYSKIHGRFMAGRDLCVADNDKAFVDMLSTVLTDEKENQKIAHQGKATMNQYFSFDAFCETLKSAINRK